MLLMPVIYISENKICKKTSTDAFTIIIDSLLSWNIPYSIRYNFEFCLNVTDASALQEQNHNLYIFSIRDTITTAFDQSK
jgi:hypothetical protein